MKLSAILGSQLLLVASCLLNTAQGAQCNSDDCLRALFPSNNLVPGIAFCASFTATSHAAVFGFPTSLISSRASTTASSATACSVTSRVTSISTITVTATTTTSNPPSSLPACITSPSSYFPTDTSCISEGQYINNGGFECALSPWAVSEFYGVTFGVAGPGNTGQYSFQVIQAVAPNTSDCCPDLGTAALDQNIPLPEDAPGMTFGLTFWTYFYLNSGGFVGVEIASQPAYTVDAVNHSQEVWYMNIVTWVQPSGTYFVNIRFDYLRFDYLINQGTVVLIDDVSVAPI